MANQPAYGYLVRCPDCGGRFFAADFDLKGGQWGCDWCAAVEHDMCQCTTCGKYCNIHDLVGLER